MAGIICLMTEWFASISASRESASDMSTDLHLLPH
jgi:hypothetical protein